MRSYPLILLFILFSEITFCNDFKRVDAYTRTVIKTEDFRQMAKKLTVPFMTNQEKVRAIFVWITDNIKYDFEKYRTDRSNGGYTRIYGRSQKEIEIKRQKIKQEKVNKVYTSGKGVCEDYSYLFEAMCQAVGIEAKTITGYARFNPADIGRHTNTVNHAWNSVKIDGFWYLLDATWAAGTTDFRTGIFTKKFQEGFFLSDPAVFILNHFPEEPKWQLLPQPISFEGFSMFPFVHDGFYDYNVIDYNPQIAFLNSKQKFTEIELNFQDFIPQIAVFDNNNLIKVDSLRRDNNIKLNIPTFGKYGSHIIVGVKNGNYFDPILEYKIR